MPAKLSEITSLLDGLGIKWANTVFEPDEQVSPPFIVLAPASSVEYEADNGIYSQLMRYEIEYCSWRRDYDTEKRIQNALDALGVVYTKSVWINTNESMTETDYSFVIYED